jgi:hypothetical protein
MLAVLAATVAAVAMAAGPNTARATSIAQPPTATPGIPGYPPPGGGPPVPIEDTRLAARVPSADIAAALANPDTIAGWMTPRNSSIPYDPYFNPYRTCLTVRNLAVPYHRAFNPLVYKAGCP